MKRFLVPGLLVALSGCTASMQHATKSSVEQRFDRKSCEAEFDGQQVIDCMKARGYVTVEPKSFPYDDIQ